MKNQKYKTVMCRFYSNDKPCPMGNKCHFSHGRDEIRRASDPLPPNAPLLPAARAGESGPRQALPAAQTNYKTVVCKYWEQGKCKFQQNCSFAHGDIEVRAQDGNDPMSRGLLASIDPLKIPLFEYWLRISQLTQLCNGLLRLHLGGELAPEVQAAVARVKEAITRKEVNQAGEELLKLMYAPQLDARTLAAHKVLTQEAMAFAEEKLASLLNGSLREELFALLEGPMRDYFA